MKISKLIRQLLHFKSLGFHEVSLYNDGFYSSEDFDVTLKPISKVGQWVTGSLVEIYEKPVLEQNIRFQYDTYGSDLPFDEYLAKAIKERAWQKTNWAEGVETLVIEPKV